ncbi:MAG: WhiB family transcriptional regulator [Propionibacteriaceae bacterium]|nr:WhiB family transcriptional regulator [Propionibacteriaceae bacterium]
MKVVSLALSDSWKLRASCRGTQDDMFPEGSAQKKARTICYSCPVRSECLAEALDNRIEWGVWGGMTERERRQLLKQNRHVTSWSAVLCQHPSAAGGHPSIGARER